MIERRIRVLSAKEPSVGDWIERLPEKPLRVGEPDLAPERMSLWVFIDVLGHELHQATRDRARFKFSKKTCGSTSVQTGRRPFGLSVPGDPTSCKGGRASVATAAPTASEMSGVSSACEAPSPGASGASVEVPFGEPRHATPAGRPAGVADSSCSVPWSSTEAPSRAVAKYFSNTPSRSSRQKPQTFGLWRVPGDFRFWTEVT